MPEMYRRMSVKGAGNMTNAGWLRRLQKKRRGHPAFVICGRFVFLLLRNETPSFLNPSMIVDVKFNPYLFSWDKVCVEEGKYVCEMSYQSAF